MIVLKNEIKILEMNDMNIVRARTRDNKLKVMDRTPFVIEGIWLLDRGFSALLVNIWNGEKHEVRYANREMFDKEWELLNKGIGGL